MGHIVQLEEPTFHAALMVFDVFKNLMEHRLHRDGVVPNFFAGDFKDALLSFV